MNGRKILKFAVMLCGMGFLLQTDAYYLPYLLVFAGALFCEWKDAAGKAARQPASS